MYSEIQGISFFYMSFQLNRAHEDNATLSQCHIATHFWLSDNVSKDN